MNSQKLGLRFVVAFISLFCGLGSTMLQAASFSITKAEWNDDGRLRVEGKGTIGATVSVSNAASGTALGSNTVGDNEKWRTDIRNPSPPPCRIRAVQSNGAVLERNVSNRPANCGPVIGVPSLSINNVTVTEGATANFAVTLSAPSTQTVTVVASTANGTATTPGDYTARTNVTLSFAPGTTTQTFAVATIDDAVVESAETFNVNLAGASNATIADSQGMGTINDNDATTLSITRAEWRTSDGGSLRVEGGGVDGRTVTVLNATSGAVLGSDTVEDNERWRTDIRNPSPPPCRLRAVQSDGAVVERDVSNRPANCGPVIGVPSLSVNNVTVTEGATANFAVTLSTASTQTVTVVASTANGTAAAPGDYTARSNVTLSFAPGTTTQTFAVATVNDTATENTETFNVNLSGATNATIADAQGVGTINDNDAAQPAISINNVTVTEGATANFAVTLSAASTQTVTVVASTANGTATTPGDYTARTNVTLSFAPGTTTQSFAVATVNDTAAENTETFSVNLSGATNATIADAQGVGTINDNDVAAQPTVSINQELSVIEGAAANFTISLSAASTQTVTVVASTVNDTATTPADYTARTNVTLSFAPGVTTLTFAVATINDTLQEFDETFKVNLSNAVNATIGNALGEAHILDNDTPYTLSISNVQITEGSPANFTVSLSGASMQTVTVVASTANATATTPGDYTARTNVTLTFAPGTITQTFAITTINDTAAENTETFSVNLSGATNATIEDAQGVGTILDNDQAGARPNISINSTSQNRALFPSTTVPQLTLSTSTGFRVLAINDLGMHCGDLDTRITSILPPFNVLRAQTIQRGSTGTSRPVTLGENQVMVRYSASANPNDPVLSNPGSILDPGFNGVFKTNFWDIAREAYDPFYPEGILPLFYPAAANILDLGLPFADLERLYLGDGTLAADQQSMPGRLAPYSGNAPQSFTQFIGTQPFFTSFPFGYTLAANWFEAAGVPLSPFDDLGRENPYPLMRVQATAAPNNTLGVAAGTVLASLDTVLPVSGEADCKSCHAASADGGNGSGITRLGSTAASIDDPNLGNVPLPVSVEWATDKNLLKLHDTKHGTTLIAGTTQDFPAPGATAFKPVVCQACHYSPALDLAHVGPNNINGRSQNNRKSMSAVMHGSHADVTGTNGQRLFPDMPPPVARSMATTQQVLQQTCYQCHPGKRTQCLRGAMGQENTACQDCHGNMAQVGSDFSRLQPGGGFVMAPDYYTNPATPRVPWVNQPGCGSCHTGDAFSNIPATGVYKAADNIRLLQAWRINDPKATAIVPTNKRFAESVVTTAENTAAAGNPKLYRTSSGHGGLSCMSCHGSTHAEWSSSPANPNANDNLAPTQLQGHPGSILECNTCHTASTGVNLGGPHGMHPVGDSTWISKHKDIAKTTEQKNTCRACHGMTGQGTPLSRVPVARVVGSRSFAKGEQVNCTKCHSNKL